MDNLMNLIAELKSRDFKITTNNKGVEQLQQTQRNTLKAELNKGIYVVKIHHNNQISTSKIIVK